jgi:hypothetical protein
VELIVPESGFNGGAVTSDTWMIRFNSRRRRRRRRRRGLLCLGYSTAELEHDWEETGAYLQTKGIYNVLFGNGG